MKSSIFFNDYTNSLYRCLIYTKNNQILQIKPKNNESCGDDDLEKIFIRTQPYQLKAFFNEIVVCPQYRYRIVYGLKQLKCDIIIHLVEPQKEMIDYQLNDITNRMIWEKIELEYLMSWLSTLGGAFSSLGDNIERFAIIAGRISIHQLKLAIKLGDSITVCRSKLYFSIALIQKGKLRQAKKLILQEYKFAQTQKEIDVRIVRMCQGIWHKLRYAYQLRREEKENALKVIKTC